MVAFTYKRTVSTMFYSLSVERPRANFSATNFLETFQCWFMLRSNEKKNQTMLLEFPKTNHTINWINGERNENKQNRLLFIWNVACCLVGLCVRTRTLPFQILIHFSSSSVFFFSFSRFVFFFSFCSHRSAVAESKMILNYFEAIVSARQ